MTRPMEWTVHVDGVVPEPESEHVHRDPHSAVEQAAAIKDATPEQLVTIVVDVDDEPQATTIVAP